MVATQSLGMHFRHASAFMDTILFWSASIIVNYMEKTPVQLKPAFFLPRYWKGAFLVIAMVMQVDNAYLNATLLKDKIKQQRIKAHTKVRKLLSTTWVAWILIIRQKKVKNLCWNICRELIYLAKEKASSKIPARSATEKLCMKRGKEGSRIYRLFAEKPQPLQTSYKRPTRQVRHYITHSVVLEQKTA